MTPADLAAGAAPLSHLIMAPIVLPLLGEIHVASALFYDIGVFALVVGATLLILTALGHQAIRARRRPARGGG